MQSVAAEMSLSETAFVSHGADLFDLRWFTPSAEVPLCGHATLATAHVLWEAGILARDREAQFQTASGVLTASRTGRDIELDFPSRPPEESDAPPGLEEALGLSAGYVGVSWNNYLVEAESEDVVRGLAPDIGRIRHLPVRGVMVTAQAQSDDYDFVSRYFAPAVGVDEDPVTGSAHCCLGPYWGERLGKDQLVAYQASKRGGVVRIRLEGERIRLSGRAVTVVRGELVNL
jgi:PhzF family phenazine biosynthesis protein